MYDFYYLLLELLIVVEIMLTLSLHFICAPCIKFCRFCILIHTEFIEIQKKFVILSNMAFIIYNYYD